MTLPSLAREFLSLEQLAVMGADLLQVFLCWRLGICCKTDEAALSELAALHLGLNLVTKKPDILVSSICQAAIVEARNIDI